MFGSDISSLVFVRSKDGISHFRNTIQVDHIINQQPPSHTCNEADV